MKALLCLAIVVWLAGACSASTEPAGPRGSLAPGDTLGDLTVTAGKPSENRFLWHLPHAQGDHPSTYYAVEGDRVNVSYILCAETLDELKTIWERATYQIYVEDQPVDLESFGTVDLTVPEIGCKYVRAWNVVIESNGPGQYAVRNAGRLSDHSWDNTATMQFLPAGEVLGP